MRVVAKAALGGAARKVVLDPVSAENGDGTIVHLDGKVDGEFALWNPEDRTDALLESKGVGSGLELGQRRV
jgi:hypothetical protein